jgi:hypothetical protein
MTNRNFFAELKTAQRFRWSAVTNLAMVILTENQLSGNMAL